MYVPLNKISVPAANIRRAVPALVLSIVSFATALVSQFAGWILLFYIAQAVCAVAFVLFLTLAVPWICLGIGLILTPFAVYLFCDDVSRTILTRWWFWGLSIACLVAAVIVLYVAGRRYPEKESFP